MAPVPEPAFRTLLADGSQSAFAEFVADLWRARGYEVRHEGDRLVVDDGEFLVVQAVDDASVPEDAVVVAATDPSTDADDSVLGPSHLRRMLLYDVPRERAADLFEAHFERPLDDDWSDRTPDASGPTPTSSAEDATTENAESATTLDTESGGPRDEPPTSSRRARPGRRLAVATAWLPRDRGDVRALLGDRRVQVAVLAGLAILAAAGWGLFLSQPVPETTTDETPFDGRQAPVDGSYRVVGQVRGTVDGEPGYVESSYTYAPGDPAVSVRHSTFGGPDDLSSYTNYRRGTVSYRRTSWANESSYRVNLDRYEDDETLVRTSDSTRAIYRIRHRGSGVSSAAPIALSPSVLSTLPYEHRGATTDDGRRVVRYVPTTGWVLQDFGPNGDPQTLRVRSASGEVQVDAETGALLSADVEATVVEADTWAGVLTGRTMEFRVRYRVETDVERPEAPPWVAGLAANATAKNESG